MNKETDVVYVVNRVQISASEYNQNGYTRTFVFRDINRTKRFLKSLRAEVILEFERLDTNYDVYTDTEEKFHVSWDSDLEMIIITLKEKIIDEEV
ncbi:MAG: hypothetical protein IKM77_06330 [Prevotella sp.]|nr:hypothetical protein [Prevotella sp.]